MLISVGGGHARVLGGRSGRERKADGTEPERAAGAEGACLADCHGARALCAVTGVSGAGGV